MTVNFRPRQLTLDLTFRPALDREDFLVAPSNAAAVALIDQWPRWPSFGAIISGPSGSGKSHLANVWRQRTTANLVDAVKLNTENVPVLFEAGGVVIEDVAPGSFDEKALFHTLNYAMQHSAHVLLTTADRESWGVSLPDLATRLKLLPHASILTPDDMLLRGVLVKHFVDRQIAVDDAIITYLINRMPRSLGMARHLAEAIDQQALEQGVEITRVFAGKVLAALMDRAETG